MFIVCCFNTRVMCERSDQSMFIVCCFNTRVMCERSIRVYCVLFQYKGDV